MSSYVGQGAIRFDQQLGNHFFGQMVIVTKSIEARERVEERLKQIAHDEFAGIDVFVHALELGPVGRPVQYRISGPDTDGVRAQAFKASLAMIPIAREIFWGPIACAMIGGVLAATLLTLFFLPTLYVAWYRVKEPPHGTPTVAHADSRNELHAPRTDVAANRAVAA